jgi:hypothetical protein
VLLRTGIEDGSRPAPSINVAVGTRAPRRSMRKPVPFGKGWALVAAVPVPSGLQRMNCLGWTGTKERYIGSKWPSSTRRKSNATRVHVVAVVVEPAVISQSITALPCGHMKDRR